MNERFDCTETRIQVQRADQRLERRPQQSLAAAATRGQLAASETKGDTQVDVTSKDSQLLITDNCRAHLGEVAFGHFREAVIYPGTDDKIDDGIPQEFQ